MFDIGIGEILVLAVLGLLIFGPDKLPKAAADAARWLRTVRGMAASARQDIAASAGVDFADAKDTLREIADLHPKRIAASIMRDDERAAPPGPPTQRPQRSSAAADRAPAPFDPDAT